ncbi:MAG: alkaline phosphatase family protein, partial [Actinobacteria bacterium]|nr:alkaline phosphatase family protein [Actinomycetota bacterium]
MRSVEPVRPEYDDAWIGALAPALLGAEPVDWLPGPVAGADAVVLLVLDGLGWRSLQAHRAHLPTLAALEGRAITAVAPSTTATALTSIATGLTPAEHGVLGYRMRVGGRVLNVLRWQVPGDHPPPPEQVQPHRPFMGGAVPVVTRAEFRGTGFSGAHLRGVRLVGWRTTSTLCEHVRRTVASGHRFTYAYYDGVDRVAHEYGLRDGFFARELTAADHLVDQLLDVLPERCALVTTADHGQVHVPVAAQTGLDAVAPLVADYSGEGRFRSLHARPGAAAELLAEARRRFGDLAWVMPRDELFDDGWFGARGAAGAVMRGRVGDVVLAARAVTTFPDPAMPGESRLIACHGSLTAD